MTLHFVNSAFVDVPEGLVTSGSSWRPRALKVRYAILERDTGPVLIDAGYSPRAVSGLGRSLPLRLYGGALRPRILGSGHPGRALAALGYRITDVTDIILTHLHADHVGYLPLFPAARIHMSRACLDFLHARPSWRDFERGIFRELLPATLKTRARAFEESAPDIREGFVSHDIFGDGGVHAVPLPGHALGHYGLLLPGKNGARPFLYAADATWTLEALQQGRLPPAARLVRETRAGLEDSLTRLRLFRGDVGLCHDPDLHPLDLETA